MKNFLLWKITFFFLLSQKAPFPTTFENIPIPLSVGLKKRSNKSNHPDKTIKITTNDSLLDRLIRLVILVLLWSFFLEKAVYLVFYFHNNNKKKTSQNVCSFFFLFCAIISSTVSFNIRFYFLQFLILFFLRVTLKTIF